MNKAKTITILTIVVITIKVFAGPAPIYSPSEIMARGYNWEVSAKESDDSGKIQDITLTISGRDVALPIERIRNLPDPYLGRLQVKVIDYIAVEGLTGQDIPPSYELVIPYGRTHFCVYTSGGEKYVDEFQNELRVNVSNKGDVENVLDTSAEEWCKALQKGF